MLCPEMVRPPGTLHITIGVMSLPTPELEEAACALLHSEEVARCFGHSLGQSLKPNVMETSKISSTNEDNSKKGKEVTRQIDPKVQNVGSASSTTTSPLPLPHLTTSLSGLQAMGSPKLTSVLFVPPADPDSHIRQLCLSVQSVFQAANLMLQENRPLKLHATILNTIYAPKSKKKEQGSRIQSGPEPKTKGAWGKHFKFDATQILERYAESEWAVDVRLEKLSLCRMGARKVVENGEVVDEEYEEVDYVSLSTRD